MTHAGMNIKSMNKYAINTKENKTIKIMDLKAALPFGKNRLPGRTMNKNGKHLTKFMCPKHFSGLTVIKNDQSKIFECKGCILRTHTVEGSISSKPTYTYIIAKPSMVIFS